jgi:hypothetical protein
MRRFFPVVIFHPRHPHHFVFCLHAFHISPILLVRERSRTVHARGRHRAYTAFYVGPDTIDIFSDLESTVPIATESHTG